MLQPKKVKYRKLQRGRRRGVASAGNSIAFGDYGLQSMEGAWVSGRQLEAARRAMTRFLKRGGKVWIRVFPDKSVSKIPAETRMGKGKGAPEYYAAVVKRGHLLFEIGGVNKDIAMEALRLAAFKLPVRTKVLTKTEF